MEDDEIGICQYCGLEIADMEDFKQHFLADHYDMIQKICKKKEMTIKEWFNFVEENNS